MTDPREQFAATAVDLVHDDESTALVYAEIAGQFFHAAEVAHPDRVINVGIREQLLVGVGAGLALAGMFPVVHTFAPFLVERAYEQIKLGFAHQDVNGLLVSTGGSVDMATAGRTHQTDADVALMAAIPGFAVHVPGTAEEVEALMRAAHRHRGRHYVRVTAQCNSRSFDVTDGQVHVVRSGSADLTILAVGPTLDAVLTAAERLDAEDGIDATVCYTATVRPLDTRGLRAAAVSGRAGTGTAPDTLVPDLVVVEPYLTGTSAHAVSAAFADRPHRLSSVGFDPVERRRYGTSAQHISAAGLDADGVLAAIRGRHEIRVA